MGSDPIVNEIRRIRQKHAEKFNYDLRALAADLQKLEQQHSDLLVSLPPKKPRTKRTAS